MFALWHKQLTDITQQVIMETNHAASVRMLLDRSKQLLYLLLLTLYLPAAVDIVRGVFNRWRVCYHHECEEKGNVTRAVTHFNHTLLRNVFIKWCAYHALKVTRKVRTTYKIF